MKFGLHFYTYIYILFFSVANGQNFYLKINAETPKEIIIIDSLSYVKKHSTLKSLLTEKESIFEKLQRDGYLACKIIDNKKINDSTFIFNFQLNTKIKNIEIITSHLPTHLKQLSEISSDTIPVPINKVEDWILVQIKKIEEKGYPLVKIKLSNHQIKKNKLIAKLEINTNKERKLNDIVILGYDKFPTNLKKYWQRKFRKRTFNNKLSNEITKNIENLPFVSQTRPSEVLFTEDSTKIFTYLNKNKPNQFDGFIGFTNSETKSKLTFLGYLDLKLINILNSGEKTNIQWRNDGNKQTSFLLHNETPNWLGSPFGTRTSLKIFKQDSTFQNSQLNLAIGYYFNYTKKIFLGYLNKTSSDLSKLKENTFTSTFYTLTLDIEKRDYTNLLQSEKYFLNFKSGFGKREQDKTTTNQFFTEIEATYNFQLNHKNYIHLKNQTLYLNSNTYIPSELYRFGGTNSIRGFRENTLQANFFSGIFIEYRYLVSNSLYINSITDYGYYQDKTTNNKGNLIGLGLGFNLLTKNNILQFAYTNGNTREANIKLNNSLIQIAFKSFF